VFLCPVFKIPIVGLGTDVKNIKQNHRFLRLKQSQKYRKLSNVKYLQNKDLYQGHWQYNEESTLSIF
jgi:hypothetical protein